MTTPATPATTSTAAASSPPATPTPTTTDLPAFLKELATPLNKIGNGQIPAALSLDKQLWKISANDGKGKSAVFTFGLDEVLELEIFNSASGLKDEDNVLGIAPKPPAGVQTVDSFFTPISVPPSVIYNPGETWLKIRVRAGLDGSFSAGYDGIAATASADIYAIAAVYQKYAPTTTTETIDTRLLFAVLDTLSKASLSLTGPDTMVVLGVGTALSATISVDFVQLAAAVFGVPISLKKTWGPNNALTMQLGPSLVVSAGATINEAFNVVLRQSTTDSTKLTLSVSRSDKETKQWGVKFSVEAKFADVLPAAVLKPVLQYLTQISNWDTEVIDAINNFPDLKSVSPAVSQTAVQQFLSQIATQVDPTASADLENIFAQVKTYLLDVQAYVKAAQTKLSSPPNIQLGVNMGYSSSFESDQYGILQADIPLAALTTFLPQLLAGNLDGVLQAAKDPTSNVVNCTFLGQTIDTQLNSFSFEFGFLFFDVTTKQTVKDEQVAMHRMDAQNSPITRLALRRTWTSDASVWSFLPLLVSTNWSTDSNAVLTAAQSTFGNDTAISTFDDISLKLTWQRIEQVNWSDAYGHAADLAAVLGLIPFENVSKTAVDLQNNAGAGLAKIQTDATWTLPLETFHGLLDNLVALNVADLALAMTEAMPWNKLHPEYKSGKEYRDAYTTIWQYLLSYPSGNPIPIQLNALLANLPTSNPQYHAVAQIINFENSGYMAPTHTSPGAGVNNTDVKIYGMSAACGGDFLGPWQQWQSGINRLNQSLGSSADCSQVLEGGPGTAGVFDLLGKLSVNAFLIRAQAVLLRMALQKLPPSGLAWPSPAVSVQSFNSTGKALQKQIIAKQN